MSSMTSPRTAACPPARSYAARRTTRNCPLAAASDGRGDRSASRSGSSVPHSHCCSGWTSRSAGLPVSCRGHGETRSSPASSRTRRPGEGVGQEPDVGVEEHQDVDRAGGRRALRAGVGLAQPARRRRAGREEADPLVGHGPDLGGGAVGGAVVDHHDPQVVHAALVEHRGQAVADLAGLVPHRQHDGDPPVDRRGDLRRTAEQRGVDHGVQRTEDGQRRPRPHQPAHRRSRRRPPRRAPAAPAARPRPPSRAAPASRRGPAPRRGSSRRARAAARRRRPRDGGPPGDELEQGHQHQPGQQPAGQVGQRHRVDAGQPRGAGAPSASSRPAPSAGRARRPSRRRRTPATSTRAGAATAGPASRPGPSSARPSSARPGAPGTGRRAASGPSSSL